MKRVLLTLMLMVSTWGLAWPGPFGTNAKNIDPLVIEVNTSASLIGWLNILRDFMGLKQLELAGGLTIASVDYAHIFDPQHPLSHDYATIQERLDFAKHHGSLLGDKVGHLYNGVRELLCKCPTSRDSNEAAIDILYRFWNSPGHREALLDPKATTVGAWTRIRPDFDPQNTYTVIMIGVRR